MTREAWLPEHVAAGHMTPTERKQREEMNTLPFLTLPRLAWTRVRQSAQTQHTAFQEVLTIGVM